MDARSGPLVALIVLGATAAGCLSATPPPALGAVAPSFAVPDAARCVAPAPAAPPLPSPDLRRVVREEAEHIVVSQHRGGAADGAINDVPGAPTWVVPREVGVSILGLLRAAAFLGGADAARYEAAAARAADYLGRVQRDDGAWADQYAHAEPVTRAASPTQTAEVILALAALPSTPARDAAVSRGAEWLLAAQSPANKTGPHRDDGLVNGGTGPDGRWFREWRWASDNAFACAALEAAARRTGDARFADGSARLREGIALHLKDPDGPLWHRRVDGAHRPAREPVDWIVYAPAFVGVAPADAAAARAIDALLGREVGAVAWESAGGAHDARLSPGFSFQACAAWRAAGDHARCERALAWADASGLRHPLGGWVDWVEGGTGERAPTWQRFVDTSAYSIAARLGERPFDAPRGRS